MDQRASEPAPAKGRTTTERVSPKELVVTRRFDAPARLVFEAWATPEIFQRWWLPESFGIKVISCELDVRTGGSYRLVLGHHSSGEPMAFFGRYLEVIPNARIVWTNEEAGEAGAVTTATFEEQAGVTFVTVHELYPSKEALDEALASASTGAWDQQFEQLDILLAA